MYVTPNATWRDSSRVTSSSDLRHHGIPRKRLLRVERRERERLDHELHPDELQIPALVGQDLVEQRP